VTGKEREGNGGDDSMDFASSNPRTAIVFISVLYLQKFLIWRMQSDPVAYGMKISLWSMEILPLLIPFIRFLDLFLLSFLIIQSGPCEHSKLPNESRQIQTVESILM